MQKRDWPTVTVRTDGRVTLPSDGVGLLSDGAWTGDHGLAVKRPTLDARIALWFIVRGWKYRLSPRRTVVLYTVREQMQHLWTVWTLGRELRKRLRARDARKAS